MRHSIDHLSTNPRGRMGAISEALSKKLMRECRPEVQRAGFSPFHTVLKLSSMRELFSSQTDVRNIVRGDCGNLKLRFEMGTMSDQPTAAIRAAQGHSEASVGSYNVLPVAYDLITVVRGTTPREARAIVRGGISKAGRLRGHFYEIDLEGRPDPQCCKAN